MDIPRLSIRQTYAQIGIQTQAASLEIQSPPGELSIQQSPIKVEMESQAGVLEIDSSAAQAAYGTGPLTDWLNNIYSQCKSIALQAIAKTVEDGNRMAQISNPNNPFAEIAQGAFPRTNPIQYVGEASMDNVRLHYTASALSINIETQKPKIEYTAHKPEFDYHPGSVEIYLRQKNSLEIQVSGYDKSI